ncbi:MAG: M23 family metallopeptidase [Candidatus Abawacabacteria bacterium]|nr:M23 family metallopeptidase [Candidatus Abawacabacteria bacterium]
MRKKFLVKLKKRLTFYRRAQKHDRIPSFQDFIHFLKQVWKRQHLSVYRKVTVIMVIGLLLSTGQLNFMQLITQADYSIDSEYVDFDSIYIDKPLIGNAEITTESSEYIVQPGDTIERLTEKFQISASTIMNANNLKKNATLEAGQKLKILPVTGLLHTVKKDDSVAKIAGIYQVPGELIMYQNNITSDKDLKVGDELIIPNGAVPATVTTPKVTKNTTRKSTATNGGYGSAPADSAPETGGTFTWPAKCRVITRGFNPRIPHWGLDCANSQGTPIYAAESGTVIKASVGTWGGGYGNHVIIDNGNGIKTIYAHLYKVGVAVGDHVERGEGLGLMGTTGQSTGPHLHFEVVVNGKKANPMNYL